MYPTTQPYPAPRITSFGSPRQQSGIALIVSLIMLVVITVLVLASLRTATLEERMAGNQRDRSVAAQSTESVMRTAASTLVSLSVFDLTSSCTNGLCSMDSAPDFKSYDWSGGAKHKAIDKSATANMLSPDLASNPGYFLEYAGRAKSPKTGKWIFMYRVTARSTGNNSSTQFFAESVHAQ